MNRYILAASMTALLLPCACAQDSLGDAARQARAEKSVQQHAKIVVDDELAPLKKRSPFPEIALKGLENSGEICRSIEDYRKLHTREEFENAVRDWFDEYDEMIRLYTKAQFLARERRSDQDIYPQPRYYDENQRNWEQQRLRQLAEDADRRRLASDQHTITRVQQALGTIQTYLNNRNSRFSWFRVRRSDNDLDF